MADHELETGKGQAPQSRKGLRRFGICAAIFIILAVLGALWIKHNLYAGPFTPTKLNGQEQSVLEQKLEILEQNLQMPDEPLPERHPEPEVESPLEPEPYTEDPAKREIRITEKELNALIAKDEETARRVAIDLARDMLSVKLLVPVDKEFPLFGGKTLRLNCGVTLTYRAGKPIVAVRGVSVGGIPIPNAWMGNIKNIDLVREFGGQGGFWHAFSEGVAEIKVSEGSLYIKLKE